ncbi:conserved hypothetical protein [Leishmania infantum JPCM5]|uniref:Regulatory_subunit_of_type_II_PKA_R-subunit_-_putative n=2 Tax=Leishmania infantum TaxID=5671 RepID=A0A6L0Y214_LEIIN|nr:conserved hypothetical protein [Leishmania infantum JPCM5]CAC9546547.1 Regulatory_subunit_of_type_II_PKA_R-subunit_-_putative [Leishmania infantum]CAM72317.1 conserved hypothetical protein [Leishmania infantum JPCM5]SUZ46236.1 Regulatory_subunit_of_type_II_PKA_R-subunit_-_putative [Leishmania infantum]|eukprot:XP_001469214.1 conserved hypothetical protein [Leishmania infantum JPCM5]
MSAETFRERTLATQYQPRQHLPPNFSDVLKEYAREVLRNQPSDILEWSAAYFKKLALETDPLQAKQPPPDHYTPLVEDPERAILANKMVKVFSTMDVSESGRLPVSEVRRALTEAFELTESQALYLITAPFTTIIEDDGSRMTGDAIEYSPFSHAAVRTIQYFQQHHDFSFDVDSSDTCATVHGMNRYDIEQGFLRIFRLLDEAGTGRLLLQDYQGALENAPYHLTHRDICVLRLECDTCGGEGDTGPREVEYEKELPHIFERLLLAEAFNLFEEEGQS